MPEIMFGPRVRKSPYHEATVAAGVSAFTVYNHMYMPISFGDPAEEYRRLTERVALWDVAAQRQIEIVGGDAAAFTQYLSARSLGGLKPGRARYAPICDHEGNLINDPVALCLDDDRFWLSIADSDLGLWAKAVAAERGADVRVFEPDVSPLAIQGPRAEDLAVDLFGAEVVGALGFFHHVGTDLDGIELVLCRSGWSKQSGFELFLTDGSRGAELWDTVMAAGARFGIGPGAPNPAERVESGLLSYGSDNDSTTNPFEAGLGRWVDLDGEHDFIGKAALRRLLERGVERSLVNVSFVDADGSRLAGVLPLEHPRSARLDGQVVGELRNAVWSPRLGHGIGIALVAVAAAVPGTCLVVEIDGDSFSVVVAPEPFGTPRRPIPPS
ncbi:MAG: hypothetical protein OXB92_11580 [Acidimicrobiaceae bacterium]|nr:glycine cleavage system protein T [Acidimicrobiia bacterium]MCY4494485.1 hypothetical protein [Acidimicrobiaceae bacterium]